MKTLQELYDEVKGNDALKKAFVEAMRAGTAEDFLRERDCEATTEELQEFLEGQVREENSPLELSMQDLEEVAGGTSYYCGEGGSQGHTCECSDTCIEDCC